jgi:hypothetical protein
MASASRGQMLRDITRLSETVVTTHERLHAAQAELAVASARKMELLDKLAEADAVHAAANRQKAAESANDTELAALQMAVGAVNARKSELARGTLAARSDRDRAREDALGAYYLQLGAATEVARVLGGGATTAAAATAGGGGSGWDADSAALLTDAEALWKRVSTAGVTTQDLVHGLLALNGMALAGASAPDVPTAAGTAAAARGAAGAPGSATSAAAAAASAAVRAGSAGVAAAIAVPEPVSAAMYATLGPKYWCADVAKCRDALAELAATAKALQADTARLLQGAGAPGCGAGDAAAGAGAVRVALTLVEANLALQTQIVAALEPRRASIQASLDEQSGGGSPRAPSATAGGSERGRGGSGSGGKQRAGTPAALLEEEEGDGEDDEA